MMKFAQNPFRDPTYFRRLILKNTFFEVGQKDVSGKSLACLFLTRFCTVGCPFCFFKSAPAWRARHVEDQFSDEGIKKFIEFSKDANLGYLLVSGGGEPLMQKQHILKLVEEVHSDRIVLVTSGNWAKNFDSALKYVESLYKAFKSRKVSTKLVLRISVSEGHSIRLGIQPALNLINIFDTHFYNEQNFRIQLKAFKGDNALEWLLENLPEATLSSHSERLVSDNDILVKIIPEKLVLSLKSGYLIDVGISKIFHSSLQPDLNNYASISDGIKIYEEDLQCSEDYNSAVTINTDGRNGLDWSINYNGNVCIWQNQIRDNDMNLYEDSYQKILESNLKDPLTYSLIDKGNLYRDRIVMEVSPKAVLRAKAIGLRDSAGAIIFEEEKLRLYYSIRVLQDYIEEGKICESSIHKWPKDIAALVKMEKSELIFLYQESPYNVVYQQKQKKFDEAAWYDFLELVKLGHYDLSKEEISDAMDFYNTYALQKIDTLSRVEPQIGDVTRRLTERLTYIKTMRSMGEASI